MATMQRITPFLWFDTQAEDAANFYVSVFPRSRIVQVERYGSHGPGAKGSVMMVVFELDGVRFMALNGGPIYTINEAVSFVVNCEGQTEIDHYWSRLTDGGREVECGWLKDRFGVSWQVVPANLGELMRRSDGAGERVMGALLQMTKLDVAKLEAAANGAGAST